MGSVSLWYYCCENLQADGGVSVCTDKTLTGSLYNPEQANTFFPPAMGDFPYLVPAGIDPHPWDEHAFLLSRNIPDDVRNMDNLESQSGTGYNVVALEFQRKELSKEVAHEYYGDSVKAWPTSADVYLFCQPFA